MDEIDYEEETVQDIKEQMFHTTIREQTVGNWCKIEEIRN